MRILKYLVPLVCAASLPAQTVATCSRAGSRVTIKTQGRDTACVLASGAVKYTVTVSAASAPVVQPTPVPTPALPPTNAFASIDFESGRISDPFYTDGGSQTTATVIDDPTGAGRGKVMQLGYRGSGTVIDANRAVYLATRASMPLHFFFSGDVYFPAGIANYTNGAVQRKLIYNRDQSNPNQTLVIFLWGDRLGYDIQTPSDNQRQGLATVTPGVWHRIEYEEQFNSSPSVADGVFRLWLDGTLVSEQINIKLYSRGSPGYPEMMGVGFQREGGANIGVNETSVNEVRYWDRIVYSATGRVP